MWLDRPDRIGRRDRRARSRRFCRDESQRDESTDRKRHGYTSPGEEKHDSDREAEDVRLKRYLGNKSRSQDEGKTRFRERDRTDGGEHAEQRRTDEAIAQRGERQFAKRTALKPFGIGEQKHERRCVDEIETRTRVE
jgi:hypothetical protein